jgi:hypothetical protein
MLGTQRELEFWIEPLVGYRTWRMSEDLEIKAVAHDIVWPVVEDAAAICLKQHPRRADGSALHRPNDVPVKTCMCGFYGYWTIDDLRTRSLWTDKVIAVRGAVVGWGKAWTAEYGWRAKYARPVALLDWPERRRLVQNPFDPERDGATADKWNAIAAQIAERYNIPLVSNYVDLRKIAEAYGRAR